MLVVGLIMYWGGCDYNRGHVPLLPVSPFSINCKLLVLHCIVLVYFCDAYKSIVQFRCIIMMMIWYRCLFSFADHLHFVPGSWNFFKVVTSFILRIFGSISHILTYIWLCFLSVLAGIIPLSLRNGGGAFDTVCPSPLSASGWATASSAPPAPQPMTIIMQPLRGGGKITVLPFVRHCMDMRINYCLSTPQAAVTPSSQHMPKTIDWEFEVYEF